jgi:hypothetical protein
MAKANTTEADHPSTNQPAAVPKQAVHSLTGQRHSYVREVVVGVVIMVVGSFVVWKLGIGAGEPMPVGPAPSVADDAATNKESIFTREVYAKIQPGLAAWNVEDLLGPPYMRQPLRFDNDIKAIYNLPYDESEAGKSVREDDAATANEYEEMVWQSDKFVNGMVQHIAVLLKDGKVIARRSVGLE